MFTAEAVLRHWDVCSKLSCCINPMFTAEAVLRQLVISANPCNNNPMFTAEAVLRLAYAIKSFIKTIIESYVYCGSGIETY